jgi:CheY-like chemotaxis protein
MPPPEPADAVLLCSDLTVGAPLWGAAQQAGVRLQTVPSPALLAQALASGARLLLVDLTLAGLDVAAVVGQARTAAPRPITIVAFGPHVHEAALQAARAAGCDLVLSRGQFLAQAAAIVRRGSPG